MNKETKNWITSKIYIVVYFMYLFYCFLTMQHHASVVHEQCTRGATNTQGWTHDIPNENKEQRQFYMLFVLVCWLIRFFLSSRRWKKMKMKNWIMHRTSIRPSWTFLNRKFFRYLISMWYSNRVIWESSHKRGNFLESKEKLGKSCFDLAIFYYLLSKTAIVKVITW